jgi:Outer membrane lipoprotein-sorting protein
MERDETKMPTFLVKTLRRGVAGLLFATAVWTVRADPDAQSILKNARMAQTGQDRTLAGHLLVDSTGEKIPFTLVLAGNSIRYEFKDQTILLRLGDKDAQLLDAKQGETVKVSPARYDKAVEGTDITYEDISLKFLYWPKAKIDGTETVDGLSCWKLHLEPGEAASAYAAVELWVSIRTGSFLEGEGYDASGKLVKRFKAIGVQRDPNGGWMLKKMRIETLGAGDSITYLNIDK